MSYQVELTPTARDALSGIRDKRIQRNIYNRLLRFEKEAERQGEPLAGN